MAKTQTIGFSEFMNGSYKDKKAQRRTVSNYKVLSVVPAFDPTVMLDPVILSIGGIVITLVIVERVLERWGALDVVDRINTVMGFVMPATVFGAIAYFFTHLPL